MGATAAALLIATVAAMRHSRIELTMDLYTDPVLLDVAGAVEALPRFAGDQETTVAAGT